MADQIKKELGSGVTAIISVESGKASIVVGVTADLTDRVNAVDLVRIDPQSLAAKAEAAGLIWLKQAGQMAGLRNLRLTLSRRA